MQANGAVGVADGRMVVFECIGPSVVEGIVLMVGREILLQTSLVDMSSNDGEGIGMCHFVFVDCCA